MLNVLGARLFPAGTLNIQQNNTQHSGIFPQSNYCGSLGALVRSLNNAIINLSLINVKIKSGHGEASP